MRSTTTHLPGEIVLIAFPFTGGTGTKRRPALVLLDAGDSDVLLARVTTKEYDTRYDAPLADWRAAGLLAPSVVRLHKLATLERTLIERVIGRLTDADRERVARVLADTLGKWDQGAQGERAR